MTRGSKGRRVVLVAPEFPPAYNNLATALRAQGNIAGAIALFALGIFAAIYHPVGTCRMGPAGDRSAVVDCRARVADTHARLDLLDEVVSRAEPPAPCTRRPSGTGSIGGRAR